MQFEYDSVKQFLLTPPLGFGEDMTRNIFFAPTESPCWGLLKVWGNSDSSTSRFWGGDDTQQLFAPMNESPIHGLIILAISSMESTK